MPRLADLTTTAHLAGRIAEGLGRTTEEIVTDVLREAQEAPNEHEVANADRLLAAIDRDARRFTIPGASPGAGRPP